MTFNFITQFNAMTRAAGNVLTVKSLIKENRAMRIVIERHFAEIATLDEMCEALEDVRRDLESEQAA